MLSLRFTILTVVMSPNQQAEFMPRHDLYTINIDYSKNYYNYEILDIWQKTVEIEELQEREEDWNIEEMKTIDKVVI